MSIKSKEEMPSRKPEIDLSGPDGNAYVLMGIAGNLCKQLGKDKKPIIEEMKSGNYENLLAMFEREFGEYVDLYR